MLALNSDVSSITINLNLNDIIAFLIINSNNLKIYNLIISKHNDIEIAYPTEANEVFAKFPREKTEHLNSEGYKMNEDELDGKAVRLVAAWNTKDSDVDELLNTIKAN